MTFSTSSPLNHRWPYLLAMLVFLLPYLLLGQQSYLQVLDNLDSNLVWYHSIVRDGIFAPNSHLVDGFIGQQPRFVYPGDFNLLVVLTYLFGSWGGYLVSFIFVHIVAFWGMWALLRFMRDNTSIAKDCPTYIIGLIAVFFGTIEYWPHAGLSAAGIPLLILGIWKLHLDRKSISGFALVFLFVVCSNLIVGGLFALFGYIVFVLYLFFSKQRKAAGFHLLVLAGMSLLYVLLEYRLFYSTLFIKDYVSHRTETDFGSFAYSIPGMFAAAKDYLLNGQLHAGSFFKFTIVVCALGVLWLLFKRPDKISRRYLTGVVVLLAVITGLSVLLNSRIAVSLIEKIPVVKMLQLDRFYFLLPCSITLLLFFTSYLLLKNAQPMLRFVSVVVFGALIAGNISLDDNWNSWLKKQLGRDTGAVTFKSFYAKDQFASVKAFLDSTGTSYRVASIGIHPAVSVMNDIPAIDGYLSNYDMRSKERLAAVIGPEIAKDEFLKIYFYKWGHRAYLFNSFHKNDFIQYKTRADYKPITGKLDYNYEALKTMGCRYIISAVPVDTGSNPALKQERVFESPASAWTIYLYYVQ